LSAVCTKVRIPVQKLLKCIQVVAGVIESQQTMQILTHVLISINNSQLSLTATDQGIELRAVEPLDGVEDNISFTVLGKKLLDICKYVPADAAVDVLVYENHVVFKVNDGQFKLVSLDSASFPVFESAAAEVNIEVNEGQLLAALKRTSFAMAYTDVRYYLNGLLFELSGGDIVTVATDGHRLAFNRSKTSVDFSHNIQSIIPRKAVIEIMRLLDNSDSKVNMAISAQSMRIIKGGIQFSSKLIDGRFPDYRRVMPTFGNEEPIKFNKTLLKDALSRIVIMSNDKAHGVYMDISHSNVKFYTNTPNLGAAEETLAIEAGAINPIKIGFNAAYMLDILNHIHADHLLMFIKDTDSSMLLESDNKEDGDGRYVIMPMRL
jgi:DNA polymerase-3 subunit beta